MHTFVVRNMYLGTPFKTAYEKGIRNICNYNSVFEDHAIIVLSRNYFCDAFIASYLNDHKVRQTSKIDNFIPFLGVLRGNFVRVFSTEREVFTVYPYFPHQNPA